MDTYTLDELTAAGGVDAFRKQPKVFRARTVVCTACGAKPALEAECECGCPSDTPRELWTQYPEHLRARTSAAPPVVEAVEEPPAPEPVEPEPESEPEPAPEPDPPAEDPEKEALRQRAEAAEAREREANERAEAAEREALKFRVEPEETLYDKLNEDIPEDLEELAEPGEDWATLRARLIAELNQLRQYMFLGAINQVLGGKDRLDLLEQKNAEHKWMDD